MEIVFLQLHLNYISITFFAYFCNLENPKHKPKNRQNAIKTSEKKSEISLVVTFNLNTFKRFTPSFFSRFNRSIKVCIFSFEVISCTVDAFVRYTAVDCNFFIFFITLTSIFYFIPECAIVSMI